MNTLQSIMSIASNHANLSTSSSKNDNRINSVGETLEEYIRDAFSDNLAALSEADKAENHTRAFSYCGNSNNPPDFMLKNGDAIEVKKIQSATAGLALNSSYPKDRLYSSNPMLTTCCRQCEEWDVKDMLYVIGHVPKVKKELESRSIKSLWMVYGDCFVAEKAIYERVAERISSGIKEIENISLDETEELGRVNKVDPLGITYLRVRGMWGIQHPAKVFSRFNLTDSTAKFQLICIMSKAKFEQFPIADRNRLASIGLGINKKEISYFDPNNPAKLIDGIAVTFKRN